MTWLLDWLNIHLPLLFFPLWIPNCYRPIRSHWQWFLTLFNFCSIYYPLLSRQCAPYSRLFYRHLVQLWVDWFGAACFVAVYFNFTVNVGQLWTFQPLTLSFSCHSQTNVVGSDQACKISCAWLNHRGCFLFILCQRVFIFHQDFVLIMATFWLDTDWGLMSKVWSLSTWYLAHGRYRGICGTFLFFHQFCTTLGYALLWGFGVPNTAR